LDYENILIKFINPYMLNSVMKEKTPDNVLILILKEFLDY